MRCSVFSLGCVAVAALLFGLAAPASAEVIAHYSFDADYTDSSGNAKHGVAFDGGGTESLSDPDGDTGGVSITTAAGQSVFGGGAVSFTAERDYVDIPTMSFADGEAYSIAFWARQEQESIAFFIGEPSGGTYVIGLVGNMFRWRGNANYGSEPAFDVPDAAGPTTWHHYAVAAGDFNENGTVDGIRIYVDGQIGGTKSFTDAGTPGTGFIFDAIGAAYPNTINYDLEGQVDEVWIFNQTLTADEVSSLYTSNVVPEPSSLMLALGCFVALGFGVRRSQRNRM